MRKSSLLLGLMVLCVSLLTACGFKLRGSYDLPFDTLYIMLPESHELYAGLKRNIEASTKTRIVTNREEAQATLTVVYDRTSQGILSLSGTGRVTEYQLVRTFAFRVIDTGTSFRNAKSSCAATCRTATMWCWPRLRKPSCWFATCRPTWSTRSCAVLPPPS